MIAQVIKIPVLHPGVHNDLLVTRGEAPELFSFEIVTRSKLKSSLFIIKFLQLFFLCSNKYIVRYLVQNLFIIIENEQIFLFRMHEIFILILWTIK
uniref:Uncharacterized protein n=1 Tax=Streptococcus suis TaxID=1307 RepID=A0A2I7ZF65_STRSU|nr:hypothetical protein [Streptococcus suis]QID26657.1 hypothetical protein YS388-GM000009 [Streptococcus suis]